MTHILSWDHCVAPFGNCDFTINWKDRLVFLPIQLEKLDYKIDNLTYYHLTMKTDQSVLFYVSGTE